MDPELKRRLHEVTRNPLHPEGVPYQSVFYRGELVVAGERKDTWLRHQLIRHSDLKGKKVLDLGCNIGAASFLAHESGAKVEGWDRRDFLIDTAKTLARHFGYRIDFRVRDIGNTRAGKWDTCFCFSVYRHAPSLTGVLARCRVVYFETNVRDGTGFPEALRGEWNVETVGSTAGGRRFLYRMER